MICHWFEFTHCHWFALVRVISGDAYFSIPRIFLWPRIWSFFTFSDQIQSVIAWLTLLWFSQAYCFNRSAVSSEKETFILCFIGSPMCGLCVWFAQRLALAETFCIPALAPKPPAFRQRDRYAVMSLRCRRMEALLPASQRWMNLSLSRIVPLEYLGISICSVATFAAVQEGHLIRTGEDI